MTDTHGHEWQTGSLSEQAELDVFRLVRGALIDSHTGGQGGVEPPDLPLSAGFKGPDRPGPDCLTWPYDVPALLGIRAQPHFSTAVVSKALARPVGAKTCPLGCRLPVSGADDDSGGDPLLTRQAWTYLASEARQPGSGH